MNTNETGGFIMTNKRKNRVTDQMFENLLLFMNEVMEHNPERGVVKQMDCPICGGVKSVQYTSSTYNGHIHARCKACAMNIME